MTSADTLQPGPTNTLDLRRPPSLIETPSLSSPLVVEALQLHDHISRKDLNFSLFEGRRVARDEVTLDHADGTRQAVRYRMKKPVIFRDENGEVTGRMSTGDEMVYAFDSQGKMIWMRLTSHEDPQKIYHFQVTNGQVEVVKFDRETQTIDFDMKVDDLDPVIAGKITNFNRHLTSRVKFCKRRRELVIGLAAGGGALTLGAGAALLFGQKPEATGVIPSPTTTVVPSRVTQTSPARSTQPPTKDPEPTATKKVDRKDILRNAQEEITRLEKETIGESAFFAQNSAGEVIAVNADDQYEAWSLIKVPLSIFVLKELRMNPQKYDPNAQYTVDGQTLTMKEILFKLLRYGNGEMFAFLVDTFGEGANRGMSSEAIVSRFQTELGMSNTTYDPSLALESALPVHTTARDLGNGFMGIFNKNYPADDRAFILDAMKYQILWELGEQKEGGDRLAYLREHNMIPPGYQSFHKIGNGFSDSAGVSWHDLGGFIAPDGNVMIYVVLDQHQTAEMGPVNEFESKALGITLEALKTTINKSFFTN